MDVAEALQKEGVEIDKKKISLEEPIKRLGSYTVNIKLHPDVSAPLNIQIVEE
jgi:large subunit ribosomal protein L9